MGLSHEHVRPKILAKIKIYVLTRAELLITLCYEIPCIKNTQKFSKYPQNFENIRLPTSHQCLSCRTHRHHLKVAPLDGVDASDTIDTDSHLEAKNSFGLVFCKGGSILS